MIWFCESPKFKDEKSFKVFKYDGHIFKIIKMFGYKNQKTTFLWCRDEINKYWFLINNKFNFKNYTKREMNYLISNMELIKNSLLNPTTENFKYSKKLHKEYLHDLMIDIRNGWVLVKIKDIRDELKSRNIEYTDEELYKNLKELYYDNLIRLIPVSKQFLENSTGLIYNGGDLPIYEIQLIIVGEPACK